MTDRGDQRLNPSRRCLNFEEHESVPVDIEDGEIGGISIPRRQVYSGYALRLNYFQTMGEIILPQAFRNMVPVLLTQTIILFQDTSLVYVISVTDFFGAASKVAQRDGRLVEMYLFAAAVYFVISLAASWWVRRLQHRIAIIR